LRSWTRSKATGVAYRVESTGLSRRGKSRGRLRSCTTPRGAFLFALALGERAKRGL